MLMAREKCDEERRGRKKTPVTLSECVRASDSQENDDGGRELANNMSSFVASYTRCLMRSFKRTDVRERHKGKSAI